MTEITCIVVLLGDAGEKGLRPSPFYSSEATSFIEFRFSVIIICMSSALLDASNMVYGK